MPDQRAASSDWVAPAWADVRCCCHGLRAVCAAMQVRAAKEVVEQLSASMSSLDFHYRWVRCEHSQHSEPVQGAIPALTRRTRGVASSLPPLLSHRCAPTHAAVGTSTHPLRHTSLQNTIKTQGPGASLGWEQGEGCGGQARARQGPRCSHSAGGGGGWAPVPGARGLCLGRSQGGGVALVWQHTAASLSARCAGPASAAAHAACRVWAGERRWWWTPTSLQRRCWRRGS
jgi:hypothetical protein